MEKTIPSPPWRDAPPALSPEPLRVWEGRGIGAQVLRLDRLHPDWGGNKWFKLRYHLAQAQKKNAHTLVSFGGIYSNHLWALAAVGAAGGWHTKGIIPGEPPPQNPLSAKGMECIFCSRETFRHPAKIQATWEQPGEHWIPMGGADHWGIAGAATLLDGINLSDYTHLVCAVGTGTMAVGMASRSLENQAVWGFPALKNLDSANGLKEHFLSLPQQERLVWCRGHEAGGYGKAKPDLLAFMNSWYNATAMPTDRVYTAKMFWGLDKMANENQLPVGSHLLIVHSGGLTGNRSLPPGSLPF